MATAVKDDVPSTGAHSLAAKGVISGGSLQALEKPQHPTEDYVQSLQQALLGSSWHADGAAATAQVLPSAVCHHIIKKVTAIVKQEPTLLELSPSTSQLRVTVVGDTHGEWCVRSCQVALAHPVDTCLLHSRSVMGCWFQRQHHS